MSFAAVGHLETAEFIAKKCGTYTVETVSRTLSSAGRSSRTRSYASRDLIMPQEVMQDMRADDQIVFVRGQRPIRCGRAIVFRRPEMKALVGESRFQAKPETPGKSQTDEPPPDGPNDPGRQTAPSWGRPAAAESSAVASLDSRWGSTVDGVQIYVGRYEAQDGVPDGRDRPKGNGPKGEGTGGLEVPPDDLGPHGAKGHEGRDVKELNERAHQDHQARERYSRHPHQISNRPEQDDQEHPGRPERHQYRGGPQSRSQGGF